MDKQQEKEKKYKGKTGRHSPIASRRRIYFYKSLIQEGVQVYVCS